MQQDMAIDEWCMVYQSEVGSLYKYIVHLSVGLIIMYTTDYLHVYHWFMIAYILCNFASIKGLDFYIYIYVYYIFELTCHSLLYLYSEFWIFSVDRGTVYDVALWLCMEEITMRIWWVLYSLYLRPLLVGSTASSYGQLNLKNNWRRFIWKIYFW